MAFTGRISQGASAPYAFPFSFAASVQAIAAPHPLYVHGFGSFVPVCSVPAAT